MEITQTKNKTALLIALISFLFGTILLLIFHLHHTLLIVRIGLLYVIIATVLNTIILIDLSISSFVNSQYQKENRITILIFLLNIPITIGYILTIIL